MAGSDDDLQGLHTTSEDSLRQAEAAFGGAAPTAPVGVPGSGDARRRRIRRLIVAFVLFDVVVAAGVGIYLLVKAAVDDDKSSEPAFTVPALPGIPSVPGVPSTPEQPQPEQPEQPATPASYFSAAGLRRAKAKARELAGPRARIELVRVAQDQLSVIARNGSRRKVVLVSAAFTRAIDTPSSSLTGNEFGFESLNPAVPARLTRAIRRRYSIPEQRIDYMVVIRDPIAKNIEWLVYPRGGAGHFQANSGGGSLRRVG